jgi:hypothetical protein
LQSIYGVPRVSGNRRCAAQPSTIDTPGFSHPLPLKKCLAIAKAIRKIEKCNLHNEMGAPAEWEEKLAPRDSVSTFLIENCHSSNRSFRQPTMPGKISEMLETHNGTVHFCPNGAQKTTAVFSMA